MANTKKFKEFVEERYPESSDYIVGYRIMDDEEFKIKLGDLNTTIISNRFIRKDINDSADGVITFNSGLKTAGDVYSTIYLKGLNGWFIDKEGNLEVNSIVAREYIETPELRKNRITVMGNQFWFTDSALIRFVTALGSSNYDVYFKLEEGEYGSFKLNDIIKGIFHYDTGFYTVYLNVYEEILDTQGGQIGVKVSSMNGRAPMANMLVARMNNSTDTERQGSIFADGLNKYIRILDGFDPLNPTSEGSMDTLKVQIGDLSGITNSKFGEPLKGYGLYAENVYLTGRMVIKNDPDAEGQIVGVFRGLWNANELYFAYDQVSYNGSLYSSRLNNNIGHVPVGDTSDPWWELVVARGPVGETGSAAAIIDITNDNTSIPVDWEGLNPVIMDGSTPIHVCQANVYQGTTDISSLYNFSYSTGSHISLTTQNAAEPFKIAITGLHDTANWKSDSVLITATPKDSSSGYAPLSITWSISLVRAGDPGETPTVYWIISDAAVIKKYKNGTFSPNPFVARAKAKTGEDPIVDFNGYWKLSYNTNTVTSAGTTLQFAPLSTVTSYTIELYQDATMSVLLDKETIPVVEDGQDGEDGINGDWVTYIFYPGTVKPARPVFTVPPTTYPASGWYDYPNTDGIWWTSKATIDGHTGNVIGGANGWSNPLRMTGIDGANGSYYVNVYRSAASNPGVPSGSTIPPSGWLTTPTAPTDTLFTWMSQTLVNPLGVVGPWSTPIRISGLNGEHGADGTDIEFIFTRTIEENRPATPIGTQQDDYVPTGWDDDPKGPTFELQYEWMCVRYKINGTWTAYSVAALWARYGKDGKDGKDGTDIEFIFKITNSSTPPTTPIGTQQDDYIPTGWEDDPIGPTSANPYEWMCVRYKVNKVWTEYSEPSLWSKWSFDGQDGGTPEYRRAKNTSRTVAPTLDRSARTPAGWSTLDVALPLNTGEHMWQTVATINPNNTLKTQWSVPVVISGETGGTGGPGSPGESAVNSTLSSYAGTLLADEQGHTTISMASTILSVSKGSTKLTYTSGTPGAGQFTFSVTNTGLVYTGSPVNGATTVTYNVSETNPYTNNSGSLTFTINCENKTTQTAVFSVTKVRNGTNGASGANGTSVEARFAINTSATTAPALANTTRNPAGWTVTQPTVSGNQHLWMTMARISATDTLIGTWSAPIRSNGSNGTDGESAYSAGLTTYASVLVYDGLVLTNPSVIQNTGTTLAAYKGTTALTPTTGTPGAGQYKWTVTGAEIEEYIGTPSGNVVKFTAFGLLEETTQVGTLIITCNCENKVTFTLIYTAVRVTNGRDTNMLDWIQDWDGNSNLIDGKRVISPRIFAGGLGTVPGTYSGVALGRNVMNINGEKRDGLYGIKNGEMTFGIDGDGNAFFGGRISIANTINLNTDGSGSLAGGNITWDVAGNVVIKGSGEFSGKITATSGTIGGFAIGTSSIGSVIGMSPLFGVATMFLQKSDIRFEQWADMSTFKRTYVGLDVKNPSTEAYPAHIYVESTYTATTGFNRYGMVIEMRGMQSSGINYSIRGTGMMSIGGGIYERTYNHVTSPTTLLAGHFSDNSCLQITNTTSGRITYLPSLTEIRKLLDVSPNVAFQTRITIVSTPNSTQGFNIQSNASGPTMYNHNGSVVTSFLLNSGDAIDLLLYSSDGTLANYKAHVIGWTFGF